MVYLMCRDSVLPAKQSEKCGVLYDSLAQANELLIKPMNKAFGQEVFQLYAELKNQYVKIRCMVPGCTFDLWMNYTVDQNEQITNLKMFRFII